MDEDQRKEIKDVRNRLSKDEKGLLSAFPFFSCAKPVNWLKISSSTSFSLSGALLQTGIQSASVFSSDFMRKIVSPRKALKGVSYISSIINPALAVAIYGKAENFLELKG